MLLTASWHVVYLLLRETSHTRHQYKMFKLVGTTRKLNARLITRPWALSTSDVAYHCPIQASCIFLSCPDLENRIAESSHHTFSLRYQKRCGGIRRMFQVGCGWHVDHAPLCPRHKEFTQYSQSMCDAAVSSPTSDTTPDPSGLPQLLVVLVFLSHQL